MIRKPIFRDAKLVCLCFISVFLSSCNSSLKSAGKYTEVRGSKAFKKQVNGSLKLLENKSPDAYEVVAHNVGRIEQGMHSRMWAYRSPPTFELNDRSAFYSVTWCASVIAHDSYHSKLYHDYKKNYDGDVPNNIWTGQEAEMKCLRHQLDVLKQIGAPKHEIDHCRKQDGSHNDINKDGKVDWDDFNREEYWSYIVKIHRRTK